MLDAAREGKEVSDLEKAGASWTPEKIAQFLSDELRRNGESYFPLMRAICLGLAEACRQRDEKVARLERELEQCRAELRYERNGEKR